MCARDAASIARCSAILYWAFCGSACTAVRYAPTAMSRSPARMAASPRRNAFPAAHPASTAATASTASNRFQDIVIRILTV